MSTSRKQTIKTFRFEDEDKQRTRFFFFANSQKRTAESFILVLFTRKVNKVIFIEDGFPAKMTLVYARTTQYMRQSRSRSRRLRIVLESLILRPENQLAQERYPLKEGQDSPMHSPSYCTSTILFARQLMLSSAFALGYVCPSEPHTGARFAGIIIGHIHTALVPTNWH